MRLYATVEAGDPETIDVFLAACARGLPARDEPEWRGFLEVEALDLDTSMSVNQPLERLGSLNHRRRLLGGSCEPPAADDLGAATYRRR